MTTTVIQYLDDQLEVQHQVEQEQQDPGLWRATIEVLSSTVGQIQLFAINHPLDKFLGTCSPAQHDGLPVAPQVNDQGEQRISAIRFRHLTMRDADEAVSGVLNDLDEYLRSAVVFRDQMTRVSIYTLWEDG